MQALVLHSLSNYVIERCKDGDYFWNGKRSGRKSWGKDIKKEQPEGSCS